MVQKPWQRQPRDFSSKTLRNHSGMHLTLL
jgi:hypothetical protein